MEKVSQEMLERNGPRFASLLGFEDVWHFEDRRGPIGRLHLNTGVAAPCGRLVAGFGLPEPPSHWLGDDSLGFGLGTKV